LLVGARSGGGGGGGVDSNMTTAKNSRPCIVTMYGFIALLNKDNLQFIILHLKKIVETSCITFFRTVTTDNYAAFRWLKCFIKYPCIFSIKFVISVIKNKNKKGQNTMYKHSLFRVHFLRNSVSENQISYQENIIKMAYCSKHLLHFCAFFNRRIKVCSNFAAYVKFLEVQ
jgi:hypothetical protein